MLNYYPGSENDWHSKQKNACYEKEAQKAESMALNNSALVTLELLLTGAFAPVDKYLGSQDCDRVIRDMRLGSGAIFPLPVTLEVSADLASRLACQDKLALRDPEGFLLALLTVEEVWQPDFVKEAELIWELGNPEENPLAKAYCQKQGHYRVSGPVQKVSVPVHHDFSYLRATPSAMKAFINKNSWERVISYHSTYTLHRAEYEQTRQAAKEADAHILLHPVAAIAPVGDRSHYSRIRSYQKALNLYPRDLATLSLIPLEPWGAGPREALWHALVRKNYGATHIMIDKNHGEPPFHLWEGSPFYADWKAFDLVSAHQKELGITPVKLPEMAFSLSKGKHLPVALMNKTDVSPQLTPKEVRRRLETGRSIPEWHSFPEVLEELKKAYPPRNEQGFTVFLTGLSGSGKSTLAKVLVSKFLELGTRAVTLLDGDLVRKNLSSELNFSKEHREINVKRIGFVASEITKNGGIAICAPIAPYEESRRHNRDLIGSLGGYIEVYISTPLEVCEQRDPKGMYAKARAGLVKGFTGIDDPYQAPENAELEIDFTDLTPEQGAERVMLYLAQEGYLG
ncbi:bifunctional sulfate adenylyltransferase/adenylylsulfate kinase [Dethiosulfatarculus sandiegensis]|uniref:bifunctional sulfate adenylyltransferase/adenylylsulfate kinase n=1 Tax=Dethiosulfatarculus sandiegensis TaxID=1429043 RepID=UPI0006FC464E|nr:bifunctional sulfate adenylyltransferase/adenylylsulfate kinase [Dethiosulfatarculus sandiegensis]